MRSDDASHARPSSFILILDSLAALLIALAIWMTLVGGFSFSVAGLKVSAHGGARAALAAALVIAIRLTRARRQGAFGLSVSQRQAIARRFYRPEADPVVDAEVTWRQLGWTCAGLCAFGTVLLWPQLTHMMSVPDIGDPLFSVWRTSWFFHHLQGDPRPLFSPNIYYPEPLTLTYSDSMFVPSLMTLPLLAVGLHPVIAYNIVLLASFVLSGLAMFALATHLTGSARAGFIAGLLFGFYPYRFAHYPHLELQMTFWMPLTLVACHRFVATQRTRYGIAAALCMVGLLYSVMYYALFFALFLIPLLVVSIATVRPPLRRMWPGAMAGAVIAVAMAVPLARPYLAARGVKGDRPLSEVEFYSATPADYVQAHWRSRMYGTLLPSHHPERELFPGVMAPVLGVAAFLPPFGPVQAAYGASLLFAFDASLGVNGLTYSYFYDWLVPVRGVRVPARFAIMLGMTLALLAAFTVRRLLARTRTPARQTVLFALLVAGTAVDLWPRLQLQEMWAQPPAIYETVSRLRGAVLAEFPMHAHAGPFTESVPFMYFSLWHWRNMINGYSGFYPRGYPALVARADAFPEADALDALAAQGVTHVTVNCALYFTPAGCVELLEEVERSPRLRRIAQARWRGEPVRLYQLLR
ncbi:MAG: hypothetical protein ABI051_11440 [Vicinamibacterales bacterium]